MEREDWIMLIVAVVLLVIGLSISPVPAGCGSWSLDCVLFGLSS